MKKYTFNIKLSGGFLLFVNGVLQKPGVDFIVENKLWQDDSIVLKNKLNESDTLTIMNHHNIVQWFICENNMLIDISDNTRWL